MTLNQVGVVAVVTVMKPYVIAAGAAVSILLAACSSSSPSTTTAPAAPSSSTPAAPSSTPAAPSSTPAAGGSKVSGGITISSFLFSGNMTVKPGEKVTVINKDPVAHTLTSKKAGQFDTTFDTGNIAGGATGTFTAPTKAGSYTYGCKYHPNMNGTLIVKG